jgi:tetratricopeptide (TPR) repeat protein
VLSLALIVALPGCPSIGQFRDLEAQVHRLDQEQMDRNKSEEQLDTRITNLHMLLKQEGGEIRAAGTSRESIIQKLELMVRRLEGRDEEMLFAIERMREQLDALVKILDDRHGISVAQLPETLPEDVPGMLAAGDAELERENFRQARLIFRGILKKQPDHRLAPQAQLRIADTYGREGNQKAVFRELSAMEKRYGESPEMGDAYITVARLLEATGDCRKALAVYRDLYMVKAGKHSRRNEIAAYVKKLSADPSCAN